MSPAQLTVDETVFIVTSSTSHICLVTLTLPPPMFFFLPVSQVLTVITNQVNDLK